MVKYSANSPWASTPITVGNYLDIMTHRFMPKESDDLLYEIQPQYTYRPDLLAFDLYRNSKLWWVFALRNPDVIKDPVYDFVAGTHIYVPKKSTLTSFVST